MLVNLKMELGKVKEYITMLMVLNMKEISKMDLQKEKEI